MVSGPDQSKELGMLDSDDVSMRLQNRSFLAAVYIRGGDCIVRVL